MRQQDHRRVRRSSARFGHSPKRSDGPHRPSLWWQVVDCFPAPIAILDSCGCLVASNQAFKNTFESFGDSAAEAAHGVLFDCRCVDEETGLVALIGEVGRR